MAHDVFISYSHKDKAVADAICAHLESEGIRCWYAPRNIPPGETWAGAIPGAIEEARIFVVVFTDHYNSSPQVIREVNLAVSAGATIIPFRLTRSEPEGDMGYYLGAVHWLDALNESLSRSIEALGRRCRGVLSGEQIQDVPGDGHDEKPKSKRWLIAGIGIAAATVTALLLIILPRIIPGTEPVTETEAPAEEQQAEIIPLFGDEISCFPDLNAKPGSNVTFGHYWIKNGPEKDAETDPEPLTWRVLEMDESSMLLMSAKVIEIYPYSDTEDDVTWETSAVRKWLNGEFLSKAFTAAEMACIEVSDVPATINSNYTSTPQGNDTKDRVYLLSSSEAARYEMTKIKKLPTVTARIRIEKADLVSVNKTAFFWTRTMGRSSREASYVSPFAFVMYDGDSAYYRTFGIVPVIRVNKYSVIAASGMVGADEQER